MAVKIASFTRQVEIITSVCVLPLHDMRTFAGVSIQADILCEGRLILGRGAFAYPSGVSSALAGINPALDFFKLTFRNLQLWLSSKRTQIGGRREQQGLAVQRTTTNFNDLCEPQSCRLCTHQKIVAGNPRPPARNGTPVKGRWGWAKSSRPDSENYVSRTYTPDPRGGDEERDSDKRTVGSTVPTSTDSISRDLDISKERFRF
jgi:hypothetical protein